MTYRFISGSPLRRPRCRYRLRPSALCCPVRFSFYCGQSGSLLIPHHSTLFSVPGSPLS
ncbi:lep5-lignin medium expressed protein 5 [Heterobasidion irregulare TC 32-1]|uniref:Lep5-lignin medium expressed protein 5 n=1 Tax=Heterobasidion irregulare (strain TC 32-1) TaxID=747525 RepID=W4JS97_HETIT|nr:lep5-lignin medium expressed protein 5 [Heterobasidion irregulare TC 32-1]ETW76319.1 lep5-lignin medium expressed protein 5 [Heterobasidion irregulare TC 32-1]